MDTLKTIEAVSDSDGGRLNRAPRHRRWMALAAAGLLVGLTGCVVAPRDPVAAAQANVATKQKALTEAEATKVAAATGLCTAGATYITALDRYGDVLTKTAPTVGDVKEAGGDLTQPREETVAAAEASAAAREAYVKAEEELAAAQAALAAAQAAAASEPPPTTASSSAKPSVTPSAEPASIARIQQAEAEFTAAQQGITDKTPLREAVEEFNAAALALEVAWLQLFAESECLSDDQQTLAIDAIRAYTKALQQALADLDYYDGKVDGIYGPETVAAVKALQEANGLPQTGTVDKATEAALRAELVAAGGDAALQQLATTAAAQQTLKLAGYWDGPVDGIWTDEFTEALKDFQSDLGVPVTGKIDAATIAALEEAIEKADEPKPTPTKSTAPPNPEKTTASPTPTGSATG